ncbi:DUF2543 family protein, partial [Escherichia sp. TWPC-MK]
AEAGINPVRIDEIAEFLNQWGNEKPIKARCSACHC